MIRLRLIVSLTPVPPMVKLLAIQLGGKAAKSLVIPKGEGYGQTPRGILSYSSKAFLTHSMLSAASSSTASKRQGGMRGKYAR